MNHILIVSNDSKSLLDFRWSLITTLRQQGMAVTIVCNQDFAFESLSQAAHKNGVDVIAYPIHNSGLNPVADLNFIFWLRRLYQKLDITHALLYRVKPVIYGSLATLGTRVKAISTITGLGYVYTQRSVKTLVLRTLTTLLYKISLRQAHWVFFQNKDDRLFFLAKNLVKSEKSSVVGGSGVDLNTFPETPLPDHFSFLMAARLLKDKGIWEYLNAAAALKKLYPDVSFKLAGGPSDNPAAIPVEDIKYFCTQHHIDYLGQVADMAHALQSCSVFVLPSYREGMPRAGLEALSSGRPIITSDTQGCRDLIDQNGFLVPIQDTESLKDSMETMIKIAPEKLGKMAQNSRHLAQTVYDVQLVDRAVMDVINGNDSK